MKSKNLLIATLMILFTIPTVYSQNVEGQKKVKIVKITKDENGNITKDVEEAEGDEADELLKDFNEKQTEINDEQKRIIEKQIKVIVDDEDGDSPQIFMKKMGDEDFKWVEMNDLPEDVDIQIIENETGHCNERKMRKPHFEFTPREGRRAMHFDERMPMDNFHNDNKAGLGVMIEDTPHGVVVEDFEEGSVAESAGLRRGDVILKINDAYVFSDMGLVEALKPYNPGEKVKVKYLRNGDEKSTSVKLSSREN
ncbi:MAG TPA: PDZ domain-containing protein [Saprospiraceae bacterium]|nr:PDZ domain-containing protein [Lewinellaceae bacterium]HPQ20235.1 PDZ domain-containing protein [Saprospiraceae bacterium]